MKPTRKVNRESRINLLQKVLPEVKRKCDNGDFRRKHGESVQKYLDDNGIRDTSCLTAILKLGIIYKDNFSLMRWKQNIPITRILCVKILDKAYEVKLGYVNNRALKEKGATSILKKPNSKIKIIQQEIKNDLPKVGIIRRFLRWLY